MRCSGNSSRIFSEISLNVSTCKRGSDRGS
jgi:hypothetical protein